VWITLLPGKVELYNLAQDPNETKNVAAEHPELVAKLKSRIESLAQESVKPLFFGPHPMLYSVVFLVLHQYLPMKVLQLLNHRSTAR
jgi:hypothetical protein